MGRGWVAFALVAAAALVLINPAPADSAAVDLVVDGPNGLLWNGTVNAEPATALGALTAGASEGGFEVSWTGYGSNLYVTSIAGFEAAGEAGWCIQSGDEVLEDSPVGAAALVVQDGWTVRWYWAENGCDQY